MGRIGEQKRMEQKGRKAAVTILGLERATSIVDTALAEARRLALAPLGVAVLDAGGHLLVFKREDRAGILRFDIAHAKAWGALGMGFGTRELAQRAARSPAFVAALTGVSGGRVAPSPGGVLIADAGGDILGAVGISGDTGEHDEACAIAGIEAAGLVAHPGVPGR
jgi:uncharacterized protein GlcG (DUF336 family)